MARPHCGINFCTTAKIRSDCFWTFGLNKKNIISTKSEQLSLKMETYFSPKREGTIIVYLHIKDRKTPILENYTHI